MANYKTNPKSNQHKQNIAKALKGTKNRQPNLEKDLYIVYALVHDEKIQYIGSTSQKLKTRLIQHYAVARQANRHSKLVEYLRENKDVQIMFLASHATKSSAKRAENLQMMIHNTLNKLNSNKG